MTNDSPHTGPAGKFDGGGQLYHDLLQMFMPEHLQSDSGCQHQCESVFLSHVLDSVSYPIILINLEMRIIYCNKAGSEFYQKERHDLIGQKCNVLNTKCCKTPDCCILRLQKSSQDVICTNSLRGGDFQIYLSRLLGPGGQQVGYTHIVTDKTALRKKEEQIKLNEEILSHVKPLYAGSIWEYDSQEKSLRRNAVSNDDFLLPDIIHNVPESLIGTGKIHPRSIENFRNIFQVLDGGEIHAESEIAVWRHDQNIAWFHVSAVNVFGESGSPIKAILIGRDITWQKEEALRAEKERQRLLSEINKDSLTGLFNYKYMREKVAAYLKARPAAAGGALLMVDIDDFQLLNRAFGHQEGDDFLRKTAFLIRESFREEDLVCRISADEFLVFTRRGNEAGIKETAAELCHKVKLLGADYEKEGFDNNTIGVSLGIALLGEEEVDFDELYRYADKALFAAKQKGKNDCVVYGHIL